MTGALGNTAETEGHRVTKMSPQTLDLPESSPELCESLRENHGSRIFFKQNMFWGVITI